jgi:hypothetical protein
VILGGRDKTHLAVSAGLLQRYLKSAHQQPRNVQSVLTPPHLRRAPQVHTGQNIGHVVIAWHWFAVLSDLSNSSRKAARSQTGGSKIVHLLFMKTRG